VSASSNNGGQRSGGFSAERRLTRRFYKTVTLADGSPTSAVGAPPTPNPSPQGGGGYRVQLDGKPVRTPAKALLALPTRALAEAVAGEWAAQREHIDPATMPLTRLANSAIDGVQGREAEVRADIVRYAGSDLLCYRASEPEGLVWRQAEMWDPVLDWASEGFGVRFAVAQGLMPVIQPEPTTSAIAAALEGFDAFSLAALHVMTTLTGSALLALAHARGRLTAQQAWTAAHVDEDWQIARWGEDGEAAARRQRRWSEMQAAGRMLALLG
jgi:chaperone required for assembly of F1-ATPase